MENPFPGTAAMSDAHVPFSRSVLKRLIKNLAIIYILVTPTANPVHVWIGFVNIRAQVRENLTAFRQMFQPILREGLCRFDAERRRVAVRGMLMSPFLTGIRIENEFGEVIELAGTVEIEPGVPDFVEVEARADLLSRKPRFFTRLCREAFGVDYDGVYVGRATLYSCDTVVWSEVWRDMGGILFSALPTTVALWSGLVWIGRRLLGRPPTNPTMAVRAPDPDQPETTGGHRRGRGIRRPDSGPPGRLQRHGGAPGTVPAGAGGGGGEKPSAGGRHRTIGGNGSGHRSPGPYPLRQSGPGALHRPRPGGTRRRDPGPVSARERRRPAVAGRRGRRPDVYGATGSIASGTASPFKRGSRPRRCGIRRAG